MNKPTLPEPVVTTYSKEGVAFAHYSKAQVDTHVKAWLEYAAQVHEELAKDWGDGAEEAGMKRSAKVIRSLIK